MKKQTPEDILKKLTPEDIDIKSPGKQAKKAIKEKYQSIENFAKVIDMGETTIYQYLKRTDLGSQKFKVRFMNAFDSGFYDIVLPKEKQIKTFVDKIFYNYYKYISKEDLETFKKVIKLCEEEDFKTDILKMKRNKAWYYFKNKRTDQAIEMMEDLIWHTYERKYYYHWYYFKCDLAVMYGYLTDTKKALEIHEILELENFDKSNDMEFKDRALYKHYYHYGVMCNRVGQHDKAKELFEKSLKYIRVDRDKGISTVGIGLSHKKKGEYDKALEYYFKSLDIQPSIEYKISTFNNISEVYKQKEDYETAMNYIIKAKRWIKWFEIETKYIVYVTYLEIKFLMGEVELALRELMTWTLKGDKKRIPRGYIITALNSLINLAKDSKSYDILAQVEEMIVYIINQNKDKAFIEGLRCCLGCITVIFYEENYKRRVLSEK